MTILVPALARDGGYADLEVLHASWVRYAPTVPLWVAWKGPHPPVVPGATLLEQAATHTHGCHALRQLVDTCDDETLVLLNDDMVLTPTTLALLTEDLADLRARGTPLGMVGIRSNYTAGPSNIRRGTAWAADNIRFLEEDYVLPAPWVAGTAFAIERAAIQGVPEGWSAVHWWADSLLSYDLTRQGRSHWVSRAYVHHIGSQATGRDRWPYWLQTSQAWLREHRPDFAAAMGWT